MRPVVAMALLLGSSSVLAAPLPVPWYERQTCKAILPHVYVPRFDAATQALMKLELSADPDDKACAVYLRVVLAEMRVAALGGITEANTRYREFYLSQMIGLANQYGHLGPRFADFEMEAWSRRVRTYFEEGRTMDAVSAARTADRMLEQRRGEWTPAADFVAGTFNSAVGHASTPLRLLFNMAGIDGDITTGYHQIERLYTGDTVYKYEALYIAFHFAREREGSPFGDRRGWAEALYREFPWNPQYLFDVGLAWRDARQCDRALRAYQPVLDKMRVEPDIWSGLMRGKLYWAGALCAIDTGDLTLGRRLTNLCRQQGSEYLEPDIEALEEALEDALENASE